jgi:hypothetical protein
LHKKLSLFISLALQQHNTKIQARTLFKNFCGVMKRVHEVVVHRDLKPSQFAVSQEGELLLMVCTLGSCEFWILADIHYFSM